jgi:indolepyruvate ferredoxin oxidoreductase
MSKTHIDPRFLKTSGVEVFTGNELLVKGAIEAGVALLTGYPGSPVSDVFDVVHEIAPYLAERGMVAQIANNEALSTARLNGARQAGLRALSVMKSVGLHVAADALAVGNLSEVRKPEGGAVVIVGDDPWNETTQINSDSRFLSRHLHMPIVEPATFQELKDWIDHAFYLSGVSDLYVTYIITTNQADGGGTVTVKPHLEMPVSELRKTTLSSGRIAISDSVLIPPHTSWREATLEDRMRRLLVRAQELGLNQWRGPRAARMPVGFVTSGLAYSYLEDVLRILGLWGELPVLKLGVTYPLDQTQILDLAQRVEHLVVVEEKRGFLEGQIAEILVNERQAGRIKRLPALWGKKFPNEEPGFPSTRGLNASVVLEILGPAFLRWKEFFPHLNIERVQQELKEIEFTQAAGSPVPTRTPTFCPGCPHRDSAVASIAIKKEFLKKETPSDVIFHGESGCHSMLQFAPFEGLMQNYSGMGLGGRHRRGYVAVRYQQTGCFPRGFNVFPFRRCGHFGFH